MVLQKLVLGWRSAAAADNDCKEWRQNILNLIQHNIQMKVKSLIIAACCLMLGACAQNNNTQAIKQ